jgi:hypothetical protein
MATKSMAYDHPTYLTRLQLPGDEAGGAATTAYGKFAAFTAMLLFSAQITVTVAGTQTGAAGGFNFLRMSGTATTTMTTVALSTNIVGFTQNVLFSTNAGGLAIAQGDVIQAVSLTDATVKAAIGYEVALLPGATISV